MKNKLQDYIKSVTAQDDLYFGDKVDKLLQYCCDLFELEIGIISRIIGNEYTVMKVSIDDQDAIKPGDKFELETTYCTIVCSTQQTIGFPNITMTEWSNHPAYEKFGSKAYYGTPIIIGRQIYGTLNFSSPNLQSASNSNEIIQALELLSEWLTYQLNNNPDSKYLCSIICNNSFECSSPLKWCFEQNFDIKQKEKIKIKK